MHEVACDLAMLRRMWAWAALLLATILAHALLPIAPPTVKTSGSPFSASTLEVSTAPNRKTEVAEQRQVLKDPASDAEPLIPVIAPQPIERAPVWMAQAAARGPPQLALAIPISAYPTGASLPRAPPLS